MGKTKNVIAFERGMECFQHLVESMPDKMRLGVQLNIRKVFLIFCPVSEYPDIIAVLFLCISLLIDSQISRLMYLFPIQLHKISSWGPCYFVDGSGYQCSESPLLLFSSCSLLSSLLHAPGRRDTIKNNL